MIIYTKAHTALEMCLLITFTSVKMIKPFISQKATLSAHWLESPCDEVNDWCDHTDLLHSGIVDLTNLSIVQRLWFNSP